MGTSAIYVELKPRIQVYRLTCIHGFWYYFGAREPEVEEPLLASGLHLFRPETLLQVEFDIAAEPKALSSADLRNLVQKYGSFKASARALGISEAFFRQNAQEKKYKRRGK